MRYVSIFSGIEAASVAWGPLGWEPVAFAEIEPFPCRVLEHRFPGVPNLGDVSEVDWSPYRGSVDVVVGGSPCQSFSVAGNRMDVSEDGACPTLRASTHRHEPIVCMTDTQPHATIDCETCGALSMTMHKDPPVAAYAVRMREGKPGGGKGPLVSEDMSLTLATGSDQTVFRGDADGWVVRRLTPLECERLQGFPDGWTAIPGAKDGPRYKAIGNSMAVPVMRWIGERIQEVDSIGGEP